LEGVICRFEHNVGLQHNLSSADRWIDREGQREIGGNLEGVCDASTMEVGRVPSTG